MKALYRSIAALLAAAFLLPTLVFAQQTEGIQYYRPVDQDGVVMFETPKETLVPYDGFKLTWGAAFAQQFQALDHQNDTPLLDGEPMNPLVELGNGFNLATANLYLAAQLAEGIQVNVATYLSSRHHSEAWVKGGYVQADALPMFGSDAVDRIMQYVTIRLGHFEINYGDTHFRRSDNGNTVYNAFVGNYILDSFATEIGGELYVRANGVLAMAGMTSGEIKGAVLSPEDRAPALYGKLGVDQQLTDDLRLRLTGSVYTTPKSLNNTLYSGDRAGARYYSVMDAPDGNDFRSGRINPGFRSEVTAVMINPFVKYRGLELFGVFEKTSGRAATEADTRNVTQYGGEVIYRFLDREQFYVAGRYNVVDGELLAADSNVSVDRLQLGAGWFATPNLLLKAEYVSQSYNDFPDDHRYCGGQFNGFMIEGVLAF